MTIYTSDGAVYNGMDAEMVQRMLSDMGSVATVISQDAWNVLIAQKDAEIQAMQAAVAATQAAQLQAVKNTLLSPAVTTDDKLNAIISFLGLDK